MKPILGITLGDPCGIGPEIIARALSLMETYTKCRPLAVGSAKVLSKAVTTLGLPMAVRPVSAVGEALFEHGTIDILDQNLVDMHHFMPGVVSAQAGNAAFQAVKTAIELALDRQVDGTVTGPLNKEALNLAGWKYSGHTEIYAELTGTRHYAMMLADGDLRVIHVSTHVSLMEACRRCRKERVLAVIRLADQACRDLGIPAPRIAVAGLNPHAGENGLFGEEEITEIAPAIAQAVAEGIDARGPFPADTIFSKALGGMFDIVVAQYHDQGHIPMKTLGFQYDQAAGRWLSVQGVNITLGLPIIRTSVDHGTAFDQAWQGSASADSLINAIDYCVLLAKGRQGATAI